MDSKRRWSSWVITWRLSARLGWPLAVTLIAIVILWLVLVAPKLLVPLPSDATLRSVHNLITREQLIDDRLSLQNGVRTTLLQGLGGAALLIGGFFTFRQFQLNQTAQITERFTRAVDQLGSEKLAVRVGGISALGRIARDSSTDHETVIETLAAYIREQSRELRRNEKSVSANRVPMLRGDLQAAATILGYRPEQRRRAESRRINLRGASLGRVHLRKAHYEDIALTNTDFRSAILTGIYMNACLLRGARFEKAILEDAHLAGAYLVGADLRSAQLAGADFEGAWLFGANFEGVRLDHVQIRRAFYDSSPLTSWLEEVLGPSPWEWPALREQLGTPNEASLHSILMDLSQHSREPIQNEQMREALRQLSIFLEGKLDLSPPEIISALDLTQALEVRGISSHDRGN